MDGPQAWSPLPKSEIDGLIAETLSASEPDDARSVAGLNRNVILALAAAARCRRLMMGLVALADADLPDVFGVVMRTMYETWAVGTYALHGGDSALVDLLAHQEWQDKQIAKGFGEAVDDLGDGKRLPVADVAKSLTNRLEALNHPDAAFAHRAYETFYRVESSRVVHGGIGSVEGHVAVDDRSIRIVSNPGGEDEQTRRDLMFALALMVSAAQLPARAAGLPTARLDAIAQCLRDSGPSNYRP